MEKKQQQINQQKEELNIVVTGKLFVGRFFDECGKRKTKVITTADQ